MKTNILFWGAGRSLEYIISFFRKEMINIVGIIDRGGESVVNEKFRELIYVPMKIKELNFDYLMISSIDYADEIYEEVIRYGVPHEKVILPMMSRGQMVKVWDLLSENGISQINFLKSDRLLSKIERIEKRTERITERIEVIIQKQQRSLNAKKLDFLKRYYENEAAKFIIKHFLEGESAPGRKCIFDSRIAYREYISKIIETKNGLFLEFGVFEGKSINHMSKLLPKKQIYGFDSFEGLPEDWYTGYEKGKFDLNGNMPVCNENVTLIKGWFNDTLPDFLQKHHENVAWVHMDCDVYSSTKYVLDTLYNRLDTGTIVMFDEFVGHIGYEKDEMCAFQEFIENTKLKFKYIACSAVWDEYGTYIAVAVEIL